jgi:hypothetical protein
MADNSNIQGNLRISSGINTADTGTGILHTDTIQESTTNSGVSVSNSVLNISDTGIVGPSLVFNNNASQSYSIRLNSNTNTSDGGINTLNISNSSGKGLFIAPTTGNITFTSTTDSIDDSTGSVIFNGGILINKSMNVKQEINALDGIHSFINTSFEEHVMDIRNSNVGGFSSIHFKDNTDSVKLRLGYGNSSVAVPLTNNAFIQSVGSTPIFFRVNDTDSMKINSNATIELYDDTPATSYSTGSFTTPGGIGISNATDATSVSNGGALSVGGGLAVGKQVYIGSNTYINGILDMNDFRITDVASPVLPTDAVPRSYIDDLRLKKSVKVATTDPLVLLSDFEAGDTIDGITLSLGDRVLIKNQSNGIENGIYSVNASGAPTRVSDLPSGASAASIFTIVQQGTLNADTLWICANNSGTDTVNTDSLVFIQIQGGGDPEPVASMVETTFYLSALYSAFLENQTGSFVSLVYPRVDDGASCIYLYSKGIFSQSGVSLRLNSSPSLQSDGDLNFLWSAYKKPKLKTDYLEAQGDYAVLSNDILPNTIVSLTGTSWATANTSTKGAFCFSVYASGSGPAATFILVKNVETQSGGNIIRLVSSTVSGGQLQMRWNGSSYIQLRKNSATNDGNYEIIDNFQSTYSTSISITLSGTSTTFLPASFFNFYENKSILIRITSTIAGAPYGVFSVSKNDVNINGNTTSTRSPGVSSLELLSVSWPALSLIGISKNGINYDGIYLVEFSFY